MDIQILHNLGIVDESSTKIILQKFQVVVDDLETVKAQLARTNLKSELMLQQRDARYQKIEQEFNKLKEESNQLKSQHTELTVQSSQNASEIEFLRTSSASLISTQNILKEELEATRRQRDQEREKNQETDVDTTRIREECVRLQSLNVRLNAEKINLHQQLCEVQGQLLDERMAKTLAEKSNKDSTENTRWLEQQLANAQDLHRQNAEKHSTELAQLRGNLATAEQEAKNLAQQTSSLRTINETLNLKLSAQMEELYGARLRLSQQEADYQSELDAKQELVQTLTAQGEYFQGRIRELEQRLEQLPSQQASPPPPAPVAICHADGSGMGGGGHGPTLSPHLSRTREQISSEFFSKYHQKADEVDTLRHTQHDLRANLEKKSAEQQALLAHMMQLKAKYDDIFPKYQSISTHYQTLGESVAQLRQKNKNLKRENRLLQRDSDDLATQLKATLARVHELQYGASPSAQHASAPSPALASSGEVIYSDTVISQHLVSFSSIEELQEQNRTLRRTLRTLSESQDHQERAKMEEAFRGCTEEISRLKELLEGQKKNVTLLVEQRDRLRVLLSESQQVSSLIGTSAIQGTETANKYEALKANYRKVKETLAVFKAEEAQQTSDLRNQLAAARKTAEEKSIAAARAEEAAKFAEKRRAVQEEVSSNQSKTITDLQGQTSLLSTQATQLQQSIFDLKTQNQSLSAKLQAAERQVEHLKTEHRVVKECSELVQTQNVSLQEENRRIQSSLEHLQRTNQENLLNFEAMRTRLESDLEATQAQLRTASERRIDLKQESKRLASELDNSRLIIESERLSASALREDLAKMTAQVTYLQERVSNLQSQLDTELTRSQLFISQVGDPSSSSSSSSTSSSTFIASFRDGVESNSQIIALQQQLQQSEETVSFLRSALAANEETISELRRRVQESQQALLALDASSESANRALHLQISELQAKVDQSEEQLLRVRQMEAQLANHDAQVNRLQTDLSLAQHRESELLSDIESLQNANREATQHYEREVLLRSQKIQECSSLSDRLRALEQTSTDARLEHQSLQQQLQAARAEAANEIDALRKASQESQQHAEHFRQHNELLHKQIDSLNERFAVRANISASLGSTPAMAPQAELDQAQEIIKHLRREKSVIDAKLNLAEQESLRARLNLDQTRKLLTETQQRNTELILRQESLAQHGANHEKMMDDLRQLNLLRESNVTLRNEAALHSTEAAEWKVKFEASQASCLAATHEKDVFSSELAASRAETTRMIEQAQHWEQRCQTLIEKYGELDPQQHLELVSKASLLESKITELQSELDKQKERFNISTRRLGQVQSENRDLQTQLTQKETQTQTQISELNTKIETLTASNTRLTSQLTVLAARLKKQPPAAPASPSSTPMIPTLAVVSTPTPVAVSTPPLNSEPSSSFSLPSTTISSSSSSSSSSTSSSLSAPPTPLSVNDQPQSNESSSLTPSTSTPSSSTPFSSSTSSPSDHVVSHPETTLDESTPPALADDSKPPELAVETPTSSSTSSSSTSSSSTSSSPSTSSSTSTLSALELRRQALAAKRARLAEEANKAKSAEEAIHEAKKARGPDGATPPDAFVNPLSTDASSESLLPPSPPPLSVQPSTDEASSSVPSTPPSTPDDSQPASTERPKRLLASDGPVRGAKRGRKRAQ